MKRKRSSFYALALIALFGAGTLMSSLDANACGCFYKEKNCLFKKGTKCTGNGNDCGNSSPCSGGDIQ